MRSLLFAALLAVTVTQTASAQRRMDPDNKATVDRAYWLAELLDRRIDRLSPRQLADIKNSLDAIEDTLRGGGGGTPDGELTCVSRDNDGNRPYVLGFRRSPVDVVKLPQAVYGSLEDCQRSIETARPLNRDRAMICLSRDRDGSRPWQLGFLDRHAPSLTPVLGSTLGDLNVCLQAMEDAREYNDDLAVCITRDNDGSQPWIVALLSPSGQLQKGAETYGSYAECSRNL